MCDSAIERQPRVVAVVNAILRIMVVRRSGADLYVLGKRLPSVGTKRAPELRIGIGDAVGVTRSPGAKIVADVIPDDRDIPGGGVERSLRQELTILGAVVVHPCARAPSRAVIVRIAHVNVGVVAFVLLLQRVHEVHPAIVRATGTVPCQARLGVNGAVRLGGYEVETSNVSVDDEDAVIAESSWIETIGIDIHIDLAATLAAFCQRADLHHLAVGADGNVAVGAIVRAAADFGRNETAHLPQAGHRRTSGYNGTASVKHDPNLTLSRRDRGLIHEAEQTAALAAGLRLGTRGLCDIGNDVETQPAIGAERDRHSVAHVA